MREATAALYHGTAPHPDTRIGNDVGGENSIVVNLDGAGYLCAIADNGIAEDVGIVADMHSLHDTVAIADDGAIATEGCAVDDHILTDDVMIADREGCLVTRITEILRNGSKHSALVDGVVGTQGRAGHYAHVRIDNAIVTYHCVGLYIGKRIYRHIVAYPG